MSGPTTIEVEAMTGRGERPTLSEFIEHVFDCYVKLRYAVTMTVTALRPPEAVGFGRGLRCAGADLDGLREVPLGSLGESELGASLEGLARMEAQLASLRLTVLGEADRRRVADRTGDTATDAWAARLTGDTREVMRGGVLLARDLRTRFRHTRDAFASGDLSLAQVRVIVPALRQAPGAATSAQLVAAEEFIVAKGTGAASRSGRRMDPKRLRQAARRMFDPIDRALADEHEARMLGREERRAEASMFLQLSDNGDGTFTGRFCVPELHGHLFKQAIERLTAPRRLGRDRAHKPVVDTSVTTANKFETDGAALCELLEHLPTEGWSARNGVTLLVTMALDNLLRGLDDSGGAEADTGAARLDTGTHVSAGQARRLACNANLVPAVLGGPSRVLDLGFSSRLHNEAQRLALAVGHDTCAVAGCERPFAWCEVHHPHAWSRGGRTDLDNALPLCGHHHRRAHDPHFDLRRHETGEWRFHPRR